MTTEEIDRFVYGLCEEHGTSCECFECGAPCHDDHEEWCVRGAAEQEAAFAAFVDACEDNERAYPADENEKPWG